MASIEKRKLKHGVSHVVVFYRNGKKEKVSFGKRYKLNEVKTAKTMIEAVVDSERTGEPLSRAAANYFDNAPKDLLKRFACLGFSKARARVSIGAAWRAFESDIGRTVKPSTFDIYKCAFARFAEFFGVETCLDSISPEDLVSFVSDLRLKYADGTVDQTKSKLRTFSSWAFRQGFSESDVLHNMTRGSGVNTKRAFYVDRETSFKILDAAPNYHWRLMFACWRFLGMRREEPYNLTRDSFDWEKRVVYVHATKTEHCANNGNRVTPMFPDFYKIASDGFENFNSFEAIKRNSVYDSFRAIVVKAGYKPWDKLIQNLRASCENDLISVGFPNHVVASWIGHSVDVQAKHYLQVTNVHINKATSLDLWDNL